MQKQHLLVKGKTTNFKKSLALICATESLHCIAPLKQKQWDVAFQTQSYPWPLQGSLVSLERFIHSCFSSKSFPLWKETERAGSKAELCCAAVITSCQQSIHVCRKTLSQILLEICTCVSRVPAKDNFSFPPGFLPSSLPCVALPGGFVCCGSSHSYQEVWSNYRRKNNEAPLPHSWSQEWGNVGEASHACDSPQLLRLPPLETFHSFRLLLASGQVPHDSFQATIVLCWF